MIRHNVCHEFFHFYDHQRQEWIPAGLSDTFSLSWDIIAGRPSWTLFLNFSEHKASKRSVLKNSCQFLSCMVDQWVTFSHIWIIFTVTQLWFSVQLNPGAPHGVNGFIQSVYHAEGSPLQFHLPSVVTRHCFWKLEIEVVWKKYILHLTSGRTQTCNLWQVWTVQHTKIKLSCFIYAVKRDLCLFLHHGVSMSGTTSISTQRRVWLHTSPHCYFFFLTGHAHLVMLGEKIMNAYLWFVTRVRLYWL